MYEAVVIGASAGGFRALQQLLSGLPDSFAMPIAIVQHIEPSSNGYLAAHLDAHCPLKVKEAEDKEDIRAGEVYLAPPGYHLLIEPDRSLSLSVDERIHFSRPSIDVLFESAADAYGSALIGVILTGANSDGAAGLKRLRSGGGLAIVQDPKTAESSPMPAAALALAGADHVLALGALAPLLISLDGGRSGGSGGIG